MKRLAPVVVALVVLVVVRTEAQRVVHAGPESSFELPLPVPDRPFLLAQADRRFLPSEPSLVRIEHRGEARVLVEIHRVMDPLALLSSTPPARALAFASGPLGAEMERLVAATGPLPRRGNALTFVGTRAARLSMGAARGRVHDESVEHDSYEVEETGVETWGVDAGDWSQRNVALGALPTGLYITRVTEGAWASSALVSVGTMTLLVRRGDDHDEVRVVGPEGTPLSGITVSARLGHTILARGATDTDGRAELPASLEPSVRFVAMRGDDVAWADVSHARLTACDPRVYLGVGRPVFRRGETVHLRGHVRGCDASGREGALANEEVEVTIGSTRRTVRSDANGDFLAEGDASYGVSALVRGHSSTHGLTIDERRLPDRAVLVVPDRTAVASGERFTVRVSDDEGGWPTPATVSLTFGETTYEEPIGPGSAALFALTAPRTDEVLERLRMRVVLHDGGRLVFAAAEVWTGARAEVVELDADRALARTGERVALRAVVRDLEGGARSGVPVTLALFPSDGNGPTALRPIETIDVTSSSRGEAEQSFVLPGAGPWWAQVRVGASSSGVAIRNRPTPPPLSDRGDVAVRIAADTVNPGGVLEVDAFGRGGGSVWVTLEQGSVWESRLVRLTDEHARVALAVPERARGLATVVVTQIHEGRVRTASRAVDVRTSEPIALHLETSARTVPTSTNVPVVLTAREAGGDPRDAVVSVWMADAGYWDLGEETYPPPREIFRLPGRPASGGDGAAPPMFGAEEGRHLESRLTWNGAPLPRASFRHAWGYGGALVTFDATGTMDHVASTLAHAAGLNAASFCEETARELGAVTLATAHLPWDLVALRVAEHSGLEARVENGVLTFPCPGAFSGSGSGLGGRSSSAPSIRTGAASIGDDQRELLEGDVFFEGRIVLGADGTAQLDVPMPARAGRYRIEALAITSDGGGERASAIVHVVQGASVRVSLPRVLAVGDSAVGSITVAAPGASGSTVVLDVDVPTGMALEGDVPRTLTLDEHARAAVPFRVTATSEGSRRVEAHLRAGAHADQALAPIEVVSSVSDQPIAFRALAGPDATDVTITLPPRAEPTTLHLRIDGDVGRAIESALAELAEPRWSWAPIRLDRVEALVALARAASRVDDAHVRELARQVEGHLVALLVLLPSDGELGWFADSRGDQILTARLVIAGNEVGAIGVRPSADALLRAAEAGEVEPAAAPLVALALAPIASDRAHALLDTVVPTDLESATYALRAAHALDDRERVLRFGRIVSRRIVDESRGLASEACRGPAWFACLSRSSARGRLARAAEALVVARVPDARDRAAAVARMLATTPASESRFAWGHADADVIALISILEARASEPHGELVIGARRTRVEHDAWITVPAGSDAVILRLPADADRFASVRVDGRIAVRAEDLPRGDVVLTRRIVTGASGTTLTLAITSSDEASSADLVVPVPAGYELALAAGERVRLAAEGRPPFEWSPRDPSPDAQSPRLDVESDGLHVHLDGLHRGTTRLELPLARTYAGHFGAGPAIIVTASGGFGSTPAMSVDL